MSMLFLFLLWNIPVLVQEINSEWVGCNVLCEILKKPTTMQSTWCNNILPQYLLYSEQMMAGNVYEKNCLIHGKSFGKY
jgi:hypothetical protein